MVCGGGTAAAMIPRTTDWPWRGSLSSLAEWPVLPHHLPMSNSVSPSRVPAACVRVSQAEARARRQSENDETENRETTKVRYP